MSNYYVSVKAWSGNGNFGGEFMSLKSKVLKEAEIPSNIPINSGEYVHEVTFQNRIAPENIQPWENGEQFMFGWEAKDDSSMQTGGIGAWALDNGVVKDLGAEVVSWLNTFDNGKRYDCKDDAGNSGGHTYYRRAYSIRPIGNNIQKPMVIYIKGSKESGVTVTKANMDETLLVQNTSVEIKVENTGLLTTQLSGFLRGTVKNLDGFIGFPPVVIPGGCKYLQYLNNSDASRDLSSAYTYENNGSEVKGCLKSDIKAYSRRSIFSMVSSTVKYFKIVCNSDGSPSYYPADGSGYNSQADALADGNRSLYPCVFGVAMQGGGGGGGGTAIKRGGGGGGGGGYIEAICGLRGDGDYFILQVGRGGAGGISNAADSGGGGASALWYFDRTDAEKVCVAANGGYAGGKPAIGAVGGGGAGGPCQKKIGGGNYTNMDGQGWAYGDVAGALKNVIYRTGISDEALLYGEGFLLVSAWIDGAFGGNGGYEGRDGIKGESVAKSYNLVGCPNTDFRITSRYSSKQGGTGGVPSGSAWADYGGGGGGGASFSGYGGAGGNAGSYYDVGGLPGYYGGGGGGGSNKSGTYGYGGGGGSAYIEIFR